LLRLEAVAEEDGFVGELLRLGVTATKSPEQSKLLLEEAMEALRRQPKIREWLETRRHDERVQWINQALELSLSLLREEDAG
jgi:exonuclease SbcD